MLYRLALLAALFASTLAQMVGVWNCPYLKVADSNIASQNLDIEKFTKVTWYEHKRYSRSFEADSRCNTWTFAKVGENDLEITTDCSIDSGADCNGVASLTQSTGPGDYNLEFTTKPWDHNELNHSWNLKILATDNTNWAVVWICRNFDKKLTPSYTQKRHKNQVWFLYSSKNPSSETIQQSNLGAEKSGLTVIEKRIEEVEQTC